MSNRERIARAAEEAKAAEADKAAKAAKKGSGSASPASRAKEPGATRPKRAPKAPPRMKVVWEVCSAAGKVIKTFPYADKQAAEAATEALRTSTGHTHVLRPTKVPMD
jgi:hypothetical protein